MALQFSIFLVTSFIKDFLFISFQQENEIKKGNTLMEFKYLLSCSRIDLFDVKDFKRNSTDGTCSFHGSKNFAGERFLGGEHLTSSSTKTT